MGFTVNQNKAILEPTSNIIVSAGAGSGKTSVLTQRVIKKLENGVDINKLLILTFTNAAAKEMKTRIRDGISENNNLKEQLNLLDSAYITTFDSFALSVLKKYHYLVNVSKNVSVVDSTLINLKKREILTEILNEKYENSSLKFKELISIFFTKDDKEFVKYLISLDNQLSLNTKKEEYLNKYLEENYNDLIIDKNISMFLNLLRIKTNRIKNNLEQLSNLDYEYYESLCDLLKKLLSANKYEDYKIQYKLPNVPKNSSDEIKKLKKEISEILKEISNLTTYNDLEDVKQTILSTYDYAKEIKDILLKLNLKLNDYKLNNDLYEFNDIAILAINIIKNNSNVQNELKNSFEEIMIDEYQDTNDIQEEFISLIANHNVYVVGDIKQSIYRFRNANPYIFKNKYNSYKNNIDGQKIDLIDNFRSRKEVVEDINLIFSSIMNDTYGGTNYINNLMNFGNLNYLSDGNNNIDNHMEILNYQYTKEDKFHSSEIEAFIIAKDIINKVKNNYQVYQKDVGLRNVKYSDFAILIDKSSKFDLYKKIFEYFKIPLNNCQDETIKDDLVINLLKNLLNLINKISKGELDADFKYSMMSVLRSPLANYNDDEIFKLFLNDSFMSNEIYLKCQKLASLCDSMSVKEFVLKVMAEFEFYENIVKIGNFKENNVKLDYILNMIEQFADIGYTIDDFSDYFNEVLDEENDIKLNLNNSLNDAVKIMTIHKSKGLEFPICYFPALNNKFNNKDIQSKFLYSKDLGFILPYYDGEIKTTIYDTIYKTNYKCEEISERIRLFYVALTRAREKIILVTCNLGEKEIVLDDYTYLKANNYNVFLNAIYGKLVKYVKEVSKEDLGLTHDYNLIKENNYQNYILKSTEKLEVSEYKLPDTIIEDNSYSKKNHELIDDHTKKNIEMGLKFHEYLEYLDFNNPDYNLIPDFYKNKIQKFLQLNILKNIKNGKIYKEYEFAFEDNGNNYHGIIDLMIVYDDYIDIIDYKLSNIDDENYLKQLNGYKKYIENKMLKTVNLYLYSIMNNELKNIF